jgi:ATP-dependent RNA/DNA helicase IGHMBP2
MNEQKNVITNLQQQYNLLKMEYDFEKKTYAEKSRLTNIEWKVRRGICWFPLTIGRAYYNSINQFVVDVFRNGEDDEDQQQTEFEYGKPVCFFIQSGVDEAHLINVNGTISYVEDNRMAVILQHEGDLATLKTAGQLGIQLYFDETTYQLMFTALLGVMNAKTGRTAELRELLLGTAEPTYRDNETLPFPWLNRSQEAAVNKVLNARDVAIVHGPPGTGKTTTLVEAIYETLRRENQLLVCAQSNMAVDWISEQLSDRGISVLRIGNPTRVTDKMLSFTYERRFESHPLYTELWSVRQAIRNLYAQARHGGNHKVLHDKIAALRDRGNALEIGINQDLFDQSRVIACTLTGAANRVLEGKRFQSLFIDEAAQALEAACWIAINKSDRVIFAGDHCQLPPTIKCSRAAHDGLERTLMEKVAANKPAYVSMLNTQYRMNEAIVKFPSEWFYHGQLKTAPEIGHRNILEYDMPMVWYDTAEMEFKEETTADGTGRSNTEEARFIIRILEEYASSIGFRRIQDEHIDFGLISPYKNQVQKLRLLTKQSAVLRSIRHSITINTIDGFQGQERDVILISLVRANEDGNIGFLSELRRMNVAITRAKMKLIIVGDASTLTRHPFYHKLYDHIKKDGKIEKGNGKQIETEISADRQKQATPPMEQPAYKTERD